MALVIRIHLNVQDPFKKCVYVFLCQSSFVGFILRATEEPL